MALPSIEIEAYHEAIKNVLEPLFPDVKYWGTYETLQEASTPAVLIQVTDFENTYYSIADGRMQLMMNVNIRIMDDFHKDNVRMNIRKLALKIAEACHDNQFGLAITPAEIRSIERDVFDKNYGRYDMMVVEFVQSGVFGALPEEDIFQASQVMTSFSPDIGAVHEEDYEEVAE